MTVVNQPATIARINTLEEKLIYELGAIYDAEHRFQEAQQQMLQQTSNDLLKSMLEMHIRETEEQIKNLEQVFTLIAQIPKRVNCEAAAGLVSDAQALIKNAGHPGIVDVAMAGAQAKVEHFEITCYRGLVMAAEIMGNNQAVDLLRQNLQQEEQTAQKVEQSMRQLLQQAMMVTEPAR
jgi:ferritin-like metal-binding protein YciE